MISLIMFVLGCLVWQRIKDALRGGRPQVLKVRVVHHMKSSCGCVVVEGEANKFRVVEPCAAHRVIVDLGSHKGGA